MKTGLDLRDCLVYKQEKKKFNVVQLQIASVRILTSGRVCDEIFGLLKSDRMRSMVLLSWNRRF